MAVKVVAKEYLAQQLDHWNFKGDVKLADHVRAIEMPGANGQARTVHEFIGTDNFAQAFYERQRYEVDAGRLEEPILYTPLYEITNDPSLPRNVPVNRLGPAGVVFERVEEGGEVKFVTVGQSNFSVPIYHYAMGLEYDKDLVIFNELWRVSEVEREAGVAFNALQNHIHLSPFISNAMTGSNATDGTALSYVSTESLPERYLRTLEAAVTEATDDTTNPRRGPYALLVSTANLFTVERALTAVAQQGITLQSSVNTLIQTVIAYNGWTGVRGNKTVTYPGVPSGIGYLIDLGLRRRHFRSYVKQGLQRTQGNPDVSRFILEQSVWDSYFGTYTDYTGGAHAITWPTMA